MMPFVVPVERRTTSVSELGTVVPVVVAAFVMMTPMTKAAKYQPGKNDDSEGKPVVNFVQSEQRGHDPVPEQHYEVAEDKGKEHCKYNPSKYPTRPSQESGFKVRFFLCCFHSYVLHYLI
jgi:hypothetical protein